MNKVLIASSEAYMKDTARKQCLTDALRSLKSVYYSVLVSILVYA